MSNQLPSLLILPVRGSRFEYQGLGRVGYSKALIVWGNEFNREGPIYTQSEHWFFSSPTEALAK